MKNEYEELSQQDRGRLLSRIAELEREIKAHQAREQASSWIGRRLVRALVGWSLSKRIQVWIEIYKKTRPSLPIPETARLLEGVLHRFVRVGLWALIVGVVPIILLMWQNLLIADQNQYFREQIAVMQQQDWATRRAQLISTLYDEDCTLPREQYSFGDSRCQLEASLRARSESARAFVALERLDGRPVNLSKVRLKGADLRKANFKGEIVAIATETGQQKRDFYVDLEGADLRDARLEGAHLEGAVLRDARLENARLTGAFLEGADLEGANISSADFKGAYVDEATRLPQEGTRLHGVRQR